MKRPTLLSAAMLSTAFLIVLGAFPPVLSASDTGRNTDVLLAQYLEDDDGGGKNAQRKGTIRELQKREAERPRVRFFIGTGGGIMLREGFASINISSPLGIQYNKYIATTAPTFIFTNAQTLRGKKGWSADNLFKTRTSGRIYEFDLPFRFNYSFLDINAFPYSPYISAGMGYSLRKFMFSGSSLLSRTNRNFALNSMTLNFGFGFFVKITEETRLNAGLNIVTYFNNRSGIFNYDTTGASIQFGFITFLN
jgi:hypothetical protein